MGQLAFVDEDRLFDGHCIRFKGIDRDQEVTCGITIAALKECDRDLPRHGLIPAEVFLHSFEKRIIPFMMPPGRNIAAANSKPRVR